MITAQAIERIKNIFEDDQPFKSLVEDDYIEAGDMHPDDEFKTVTFVKVNEYEGTIIADYDVITKRNKPIYLQIAFDEDGCPMFN